MAKFNDLTGKLFGRLTAVERLPPHGKNTASMWACKCECGGTAIVRGTDLVNGHTMSCGCYRKMQKAMPAGEMRLHRIWANMKQRCSNPKSKDYQYYGGCGVSVCEEWKDSFEQFFYWAMSNGYKDGLTLERKDCNGNYCPENCEWIQANRQQRNTRRNRKYIIQGKEFTLTELCRIYGQPRSTVESRLKKGIDIKTALKNGRYNLDNRLLELSDKLKDLRLQKSELEVQTKGVNEEIDGVMTEMIGIMTTEELTSFNRNGTTFSLVTTEYPSPEPDKKGELWEAMKANGFEDLFTINSQTLSATIKELISENDGVLPTWLEGLIKIAEKNSIRVAKSKKNN